MNKSQKPQVSLIIVTYNAEAFIIECLVSVKQLNFNNFETIIIDNASSDKTCLLIETQFPWVKLIKSVSNTGFAAGVNLGYTHAVGEYIALLNPDTRVDKDWLGNLVLALDVDEKYGIAASLMLRWGTKNIDTAGDGCTRTGKGFKIGHNQPMDLYQTDRDIFAACGGAVLYKRKLIEEISFFDSDFFMLHEDTDLGLRSVLAGWSCRYVHNAVVEHKISATIGYKTPLAVYHATKNSDMVWLKNMPLPLLLLTLPEKILNDLAFFLYLGVLHGKYKEFFKAKMYICRNIRYIITKRSIIQKNKKITNYQLWKQLTSFLSVQHLRRLWREKRNELTLTKHRRGINTTDNIGNHTNS